MEVPVTLPQRCWQENLMILWRWIFGALASFSMPCVSAIFLSIILIQLSYIASFAREFTKYRITQVKRLLIFWDEYSKQILWNEPPLKKLDSILFALFHPQHGSQESSLGFLSFPLSLTSRSKCGNRDSILLIWVHKLRIINIHISQPPIIFSCSSGSGKKIKV